MNSEYGRGSVRPSKNVRRLLPRFYLGKTPQRSRTRTIATGREPRILSSGKHLHGRHTFQEEKERRGTLELKFFSIEGEQSDGTDQTVGGEKIKSCLSDARILEEEKTAGRITLMVRHQKRKSS